MAWLVLVLALPFVELWTLFELGSMVGVGATLAWCVAMIVVGVLVMRRARYRMAVRLQGGSLQDQGPRAVMGDALLVVAGVLLAFPGVISDVLGLVLALPPTRAGVVRLLARSPRMARAEAAARARPRPAPKGSAPDVEIYPPGTLPPTPKRRPVVIDVD